MKSGLIAALVLFAAPALAQTQGATIDVGNAKWEKLPALQVTGDRLDYVSLSTMVSDILGKKQCTLPRQSAGRFDIDVRYAVMMTPEGKVTRVLVSDIGCRAIETLVGEAVLARADAGDFLAADKSRARWYASTFNVNYN